MENYIQTKKLERIIVLCMLFFVAVVFVAIYSFISFGKVRKQNAEYDSVIACLKEEQQSLQGNIDTVTNPYYIEEKVRNEFGMIKEGETLYIFK